ncbi:TPA: methicillin resistance protein [Bacillus cereus]|nr:methicillin resistance protein [Bacillus cereus]
MIETSIMASILVGLILCIKVLFRNKLTPRWQYMLWIILIIRLVLPWSPDSSYSIYSVLTYKNDDAFISSRNPVANFLTQERIQELKDIDDTKVLTKEDTYTSSSTKTVQANKTQTGMNEKQDDKPIPFYTICIYIWLTGVILLSVATFIMNRRLLLYIKKQPVITDEKIVQIFEKCKQSMSIQRNIPLLVAGKLSSPTVFGFIRPKLLLSGVHLKILDEQQLRYIFYHELAHIKRRDVGVNWLMHSLLILNWFNPILWYAYSCMREDQELACDALALTFIGHKEKLAYGHTIITLLEHYSNYNQTPSLANLSGNKYALKRRILMIKKFNRKSYCWSIFGIVTVIGVSVFSLMNAKTAENSNKKEHKVENIQNIDRKTNGNQDIYKPRYSFELEESQINSLKNKGLPTKQTLVEAKSTGLILVHSTFDNRELAPGFWIMAPGEVDVIKKEEYSTKYGMKNYAIAEEWR